jgi:succinate dehydrogenase / fumarate reductase, membrane anchor subunit
LEFEIWNLFGIWCLGFGYFEGAFMSRSLGGAHERPEGGFELTAWLFMRFSGVLLLFLALGHLFIMHVFNSIHDIDYDFVAQRYAGIFWRGYDLLMLWLAMLHGLNGLRTILDDLLKVSLRQFAVRVLYIVGGVFLLIGTWVILFFQPMRGA